MPSIRAPSRLGRRSPNAPKVWPIPSAAAGSSDRPPCALAPPRRALKTGRGALAAGDDRRLSQRRWPPGHGCLLSRPQGNAGAESADRVVLAASAIESARLALLCRLPDASGRIGTRLMFHNCIDGLGSYLDQTVHAYKGRSIRSAWRTSPIPTSPGLEPPQNPGRTAPQPWRSVRARRESGPRETRCRRQRVRHHRLSESQQHAHRGGAAHRAGSPAGTSALRR